MNKKIISSIIVILILLSSISGYIYFKDADALSKVRLKINDIDFISLNLNRALLVISVNFMNPTNTDVNNLESTFDIFIESNYIGKGNFSDIDIESNSNITKQVKVDIFYSGLAHSVVDLISNFIQQKNSSLEIIGNLKSDSIFGIIKISEEYNVIY